MLIQAAVVRMIGATIVSAGLRRRQAPPVPVIVHQIGKVGSKAVVARLSAGSEPRTVFHIHRANPVVRGKELRARVRGEESWAPPLAWGVAGALFPRLHSHPYPILVVTILRDPVSRDLSAFLQVPQRYLALDELDRLMAGSVPPSVVLKWFLRRFDFAKSRLWWEQEIEELYGVQVEGEAPASPGPLVLMPQRLRSPDSTVVVLRQEHLEADVLDLRGQLELRGDGGLQRRNVTSEKRHGHYAAEMRALAKGSLPEQYADYYRLPVFTHLYGDQWVRQRLQYWSVG